MAYTPWAKKGAKLFLSITSPKINRFNSVFIVDLKWPTHVRNDFRPPQLINDAALPCKSRNIE